MGASSTLFPMLLCARNKCTRNSQCHTKYSFSILSSDGQGMTFFLKRVLRTSLNLFLCLPVGQSAKSAASVENNSSHSMSWLFNGIIKNLWPEISNLFLSHDRYILTRGIPLLPFLFMFNFHHQWCFDFGLSWKFPIMKRKSSLDFFVE